MRYLLAGLLATALFLPPVAARSETIDNVLVAAYQYNPELKSERARVRSVDEEKPLARAGYRPQVNVDADVTGTLNRSDFRGARADLDERDRTDGYTVNVVQPVFRGLRTLNAMRVADASVYAAREALRGTEQDVLLRAATAYVDVIRDRAIVRLRENNVNVLAEQLRATEDRFKVGEVTKTDVAQARASHSEAISMLNEAKANLKTSRAVFAQVVGYSPNGLDAPRGVVSLLPRRLDEAIQRGLEEHPSVLSAVYAEMAATHEVDLIRGELLPTVTVEGSFTKRYDPADGVSQTDTSVVRGHVTMPLYQGGGVSARIRQAKQIVIQRREELETARKSVQEAVTSAWGSLESIKAQIVADKSSVSANQTALEGVREEEKVGQRTILDVLNAQQSLLNAQVDLTTSERNLVVAGYQLLAATGRLSVHELGLQVAEYAPEEHYDNVDRKWIGTGVEEYDDTYDRRVLVNDHYFPDALR
jgi:outer membrane protein